MDTDGQIKVHPAQTHQFNMEIRQMPCRRHGPQEPDHCVLRRHIPVATKKRLHRLRNQYNSPNTGAYLQELWSYICYRYTVYNQNYTRVQTTCTNRIKWYNGPQVLIKDGSFMQAMYREDLHVIPHLSNISKTPHIFPQLQSGSLIYIGYICDDGCTSTFMAKYMKVFKQSKQVL